MFDGFLLRLTDTYYRVGRGRIFCFYFESHSSLNHLSSLGLETGNEIIEMKEYIGRAF